MSGAAALLSQQLGQVRLQLLQPECTAKPLKLGMDPEQLLPWFAAVCEERLLLDQCPLPLLEVGEFLLQAGTLLRRRVRECIPQSGEGLADIRGLLFQTLEPWELRGSLIRRRGMPVLPLQAVQFGVGPPQVANPEALGEDGVLPPEGELMGEPAVERLDVEVAQVLRLLEQAPQVARTSEDVRGGTHGMFRFSIRKRYDKAGLAAASEAVM